MRKGKLHCKIATEPEQGLERNLCVQCRIRRLELEIPSLCKNLKFSVELPRFREGKLGHEAPQRVGTPEWTEFREVIYCGSKDAELTLEDLTNCKAETCEHFSA